MSKYINDVAIAQFDPMVKQAYQSNGFKLKNTVRYVSGVVGESYQFDLTDEVIANKRTQAHQQVILANSPFEKVKVYLEDWEAAIAADIFGKQKVNFSELQVQSVKLAKAMGRRSDQMIIDALTNSATTQTVAAGTTGLTYEKFQEALAILNANAVNADMHMVVDAYTMRQVLEDNKFINGDFTGRALLDNGNTLDGIKMFNVTWHIIPTMSEGGMPTTGTTHHSYLYASDALGMAVGEDFVVDVGWERMIQSYVAVSRFIGNAIAIDKKGIVKVDGIVSA